MLYTAEIHTKSGKVYYYNTEDLTYIDSVAYGYFKYPGDQNNFYGVSLDPQGRTSSSLIIKNSEIEHIFYPGLRVTYDNVNDKVIVEENN